MTRVVDNRVKRTLAAAEALFAGYGSRDFTVRLWDGSELPSQNASRFTLVLRSPHSLRRMLGSPLDLRLGEAFVRDDWDVEGDIVHAFHVADRLQHAGTTAGALTRLFAAAFCPVVDRGPVETARSARLHGRTHSAARDAEAIRHHYDVGNDFYALWLDRDLVYSCAYFDEGCAELDDAQSRKLDHICRKLRLAPGSRLLDVGCGWGALVRHAARNYGVDATGITLSSAQATEATARIAAEGLSARARVEVLDYREARRLGVFDAVASVGMFEHVGREQLSDYFRITHGLLKPGGVFLNHGIARDYRTSDFKKDSFIQRYVFPDGELVPISATLRSAEEAGFEVRDVESLREHYAETLRHWVRRLEDHETEARRAAGDAAYRIWRLYMAGSANSFSRGYLSVFQSLLHKPTGGESALPRTRRDWYAQRE